MQSLLVSLAIKYALSQLAATGAATNWNDVKARFQVWAKSLNWGTYLTAEMTVAGDTLLDDVAAACQDTDDLKTVLTALAAKDPVGAEAGLKAMIAKVAGTNPYVSALLASA